MNDFKLTATLPCPCCGELVTFEYEFRDPGDARYGAVPAVAPYPLVVLEEGFIPDPWGGQRGGRHGQVNVTLGADLQDFARTLGRLRQSEWEALFQLEPVTQEEVIAAQDRWQQFRGLLGRNDPRDPLRHMGWRVWAQGEGTYTLTKTYLRFTVSGKYGMT